MELRTEILTQVQLGQEVSNIINFLQSKDKHVLSVSYGWGCNLDMNELYQDLPLPLSELRAFIEQSTQSGVFTLGESDLYISSQDGKIGFVLCHESDVHVEAENSALVQEVAASWAKQGYSYSEIVPTS